MKLIIDTLGADKGLNVVVKGALDALKEYEYHPVFCGPQDELERLIPKDLLDSNKASILNANDVILNTDEPARAIRRKKESSIVIGLKALKEGAADGFISAGSTGALLAGATLIVGRITNIDRAALTVLLPGIKSSTILLDVGANMDCSPELIRQFAIMGTCYAKALFNKPSPKLGLLNIGSEEGKGDNLAKESYQILKNENFNFIGNIESRDILDNDADVIVTDGYSGNILIKTIEGVASTILRLLKDGIMSSFTTKVGGILIKPAVSGIKDKLDYRSLGSAPMLGAKKPVFKAHGSSDELAIRNGILEMIKFIENDVINEITNIMKDEKNDKE